jgi:hypothetical protein
MDSKDAIVFSVLVIGIFCFFGGVIGMSYWDAQQVRVIYQKSYDKSMECRITFKGTSPQEVNRYCGEIPKLEDFVK